MKFFSGINKFIKLDFSLKIMSIKVFYLAGIFRFIIKRKSMKNIKSKLGNKSLELSTEGTKEGYLMAKKVQIIVNKVGDVTPWKSKCLVRAMVAQKIMKDKGYGTTLYLGVGKESNELIAHAWLRYGEFYITGGNGFNYAKVGSFVAEIKN